MEAPTMTAILDLDTLLLEAQRSPVAPNAPTPVVLPDASRCACGAPMYEDRWHHDVAAASGFTQRRFYCFLDGRDVFVPMFSGRHPCEGRHRPARMPTGRSRGRRPQTCDVVDDVGDEL
jgi:hypothetical protein